MRLNHRRWRFRSPPEPRKTLFFFSTWIHSLVTNLVLNSETIFPENIIWTEAKIRRPSLLLLPLHSLSPLHPSSQKKKGASRRLFTSVSAVPRINTFGWKAPTTKHRKWQHCVSLSHPNPTYSCVTCPESTNSFWWNSFTILKLARLLPRPLTKFGSARFLRSSPLSFLCLFLQKA